MIFHLKKKSYKTYNNILIYDVSYKPFMGAKPLNISSMKEMDLSKFMMGVDI